MPTVRLPTAERRAEEHRVGPASPFPATAAGGFPRVAYAAAHVVADPLVDVAPWQRAAVDWEATMAFRRHLWGLGFKIAEAMDTSQRGMGLDWPTARELIRRSLAEARTVDGADLACGVGTDQLEAKPGATLDAVHRAYEEQLEAVEAAGGRAILMASRALVQAARSADDYLRLYDGLIRPAREPVILHWLGDMFDPALEGYWGGADLDEATESLLALVREHAAKIDGIKISLLDQEREVALRQRLPEGVKMFTGDDFNYAELIEGDAHGHSHALLGIFDPIAPAAAAALLALGSGETDRFRRVLEPTVPLSRKIFETPTQYYKAGVVFLAWLNGHQDHFAMVGGMQSARPALHYADVFRLADCAGLLRDPELACSRMRGLMALHGIG
ncbi:MAG TPA: dihydrodipicolinate synthase family protein [Geminicoccaceae bacterium]|nr:dihydrodipicolinate synthase family protein [Geminicoccaceae bacterium]